ncbi:transposase [Chryseobacterium flavum]|uniref:transposase n=1 Tax=Chryseobacterium flavum TaxID=415851 RepID=UPI0028B120B6|nr:transposase [Chryseobacterium flavum]
MNFKNIHVGSLINKVVAEKEIELHRICNFLKCTEKEIEEMYAMKSLDADILLKWSKLLEYDFFRLYSQHLILYAPMGRNNYTQKGENSSKLLIPRFRKNIYTIEIVNYILNKIDKGEMTKSEIIKRYHIPKTTLYKWLNKYKKE